MVAFYIIQFYMDITSTSQLNLTDVNSGLRARSCYLLRRMTLTEILSNEELRQHEFPVARDKIFLAHAGVCPLPRRVAQAIADCAAAQHARRPGSIHAPAPGRRAQARRRRLLNCQPEEIALVGPTSLGLSFVAAGLNFRRGDNILIYHDDYPSNVYPWMALAERGVEVRLLNTRGLGVIRPRDVMGQVDENTRLVALASCHFISGFRLEISTPSENFCASAEFCFAWTPSRRSARFRPRSNTWIFWPPTRTNGCSARAARAFFTSGASFRSN